MTTIATLNRSEATAEAAPRLALRAYLAGLGVAAGLVLSATVLASVGLELVFG